MASTLPPPQGATLRSSRVLDTPGVPCKKTPKETTKPIGTHAPTLPNPIGNYPEKPNEPQNTTQQDAETVTERTLYSSFASDPDPLQENAPKATKESHSKKLNEYSQGIFATCAKIKMRGEMLWQSFTQHFRPHTIRSLTTQKVIEWGYFLASRGILIEHNSTHRAVEPIVDLLYRHSHQGPTTTRQVSGATDTQGGHTELTLEESASANDENGNDDLHTIPGTPQQPTNPEAVRTDPSAIIVNSGDPGDFWRQ